jgi:hypothetical protein
MKPPLPSVHPVCAAVCLYGLLAAPPLACAEWADEQTADLFEIRSEFSLVDESGRALIRELSQLRSDVESLLGLEASQDPIEVNLFANRRNYQEFLELRVPEGASRVALYVQGTDRGRVYVYRHRGFEVDVRHECTHAVLHNALPYVPMWLDEGLAEYFEMPADQRAAGHPHLSSVRRAMLLRWNPSLSRLESRQDFQEMDGNDYRDSWAWVHFMLHGPQDVRQTLSNYLYDVRMGNPAGQLSERLAAEVPASQHELTRHFRNLKPTSKDFP